ADAVGAWRVHDENAAAARRSDVDVVHPGAGASDDPEPGGGGDEVGRDLRGAANEKALGVGERGREFSRAAAGPRIDVPSGLGAQQVERRGGEVVGNDYLQ